MYDVMEPLRGLVDHRLLTFWREHVFGVGDFQANKAGEVVVHPTLCRVLVEACRLPQRRVDDEGREHRARILDAAKLEAVSPTVPTTTPVQRKRR
jgi:hypothetical protein